KGLVSIEVSCYAIKAQYVLFFHAKEMLPGRMAVLQLLLQTLSRIRFLQKFGIEGMQKHIASGSKAVDANNQLDHLTNTGSWTVAEAPVAGGADGWDIVDAPVATPDVVSALGAALKHLKVDRVKKFEYCLRFSFGVGPMESSAHTHTVRLYESRGKQKHKDSFPLNGKSLTPFLSEFLAYRNGLKHMNSTELSLYAGRGMHEDPVSLIKYTLFWILLLMAKLSFSYYLEVPALFLILLLAKDNVIKFKNPFSLCICLTSENVVNSSFLATNNNIGVVIALWAPIILVYFMDTQIWYAIFSTIFSGIYGAFCHLGEIIFNCMFERDSQFLFLQLRDTCEVRVVPYVMTSWIGKETSQDEAVTHETERFLSYFKPYIIPQADGVASGFTNAEAEEHKIRMFIFHGKHVAHAEKRSKSLEQRADAMGRADALRSLANALDPWADEYLRKVDAYD
ncbi:callose synthase 2-like protein, partial [Tanacetum coccineum]